MKIFARIRAAAYAFRNPVEGDALRLHLEELERVVDAVVAPCETLMIQARQIFDVASKANFESASRMRDAEILEAKVARARAALIAIRDAASARDRATPLGRDPEEVGVWVSALADVVLAELDD